VISGVDSPKESSIPLEVIKELEDLRRHRELCVRVHGIFEQQELATGEDMEFVNNLKVDVQDRPASRQKTVAVLTKAMQERDSAQEEYENQNKEITLLRSKLDAEMLSHEDTRTRMNLELSKVYMELDKLKGGRRSGHSRSSTDIRSRSSTIYASPSKRNTIHTPMHHQMSSPTGGSGRTLIAELQKEIDELRKKNIKLRETLTELKTKPRRLFSASTKKEIIKPPPLVLKKPKAPPPKERRQVEKKWRMTQSRLTKIMSKLKPGNKEVKPKKWLQRFLCDAYMQKKKSDMAAERDNRELVSLPEFIFHDFIPSKMGIRELADVMCWQFINSMQHYSNDQKNLEFIIFKDFMEEKYSVDALSFYIYARNIVLKISNQIKSEEIPSGQLQMLVDDVFPHCTHEYRFILAERLELDGLRTTGNSLLNCHQMLLMFVEEFVLMKKKYSSSCMKLFFSMGLNARRNVKFFDFLPLIRIVLSGVKIEKLEATVERLRIPEAGLKPVQQCENLLKNFFDLRNQFSIPTKSPNSALCSSIYQLVSCRWQEFQSTIFNDIVDVMGNIEGEHMIQFPIRMQVRKLLDLAEHLNMAIANQFGWETLTSYLKMLQIVRNIFDYFELLELHQQSVSSAMKNTKSIVYEKEQSVLARFSKTIKKAREYQQKLKKQPRFAVNANQKPADEKDLQLQRKVLEQFSRDLGKRVFSSHYESENDQRSELNPDVFANKKSEHEENEKRVKLFIDTRRMSEKMLETSQGFSANLSTES